MDASAPRLRSTRITSPRSAAAAKMSGVWPHSDSRAFMSALWSTRAVTASALPEAAARCRAEAPLAVATFGSLPAFRSALTTAALPARLAMCSGVYEPMRVTAVSLARDRTSKSVIATSERSAAQCSAVMPSPCAAFTSAFCSISFRIATMSPRIAASAIGARTTGAGSTAAPASSSHAPTTAASLTDGFTPEIPRETVRMCCPPQALSENSPVLSPKLFISSRPSLWSSVSMTSAIGVPSGAFRCRLPSSRPLPWPSRSSGQRR